MKRTILLLGFMLSLATTSLFGQGADPEKVFKYSTKEDRLNEYLKENKWKRRGVETDEFGEEYILYRAKSYGGGYLYLAVFPGKFVHYQKFNSEKRAYSPIMSYEDFCLTPEGKTTEDYSIANEDELIKNIALTDHENPENENTFYGIIPDPKNKLKEE